MNLLIASVRKIPKMFGSVIYGNGKVALGSSPHPRTCRWLLPSLVLQRVLKGPLLHLSFCQAWEYSLLTWAFLTGTQAPAPALHPSLMRMHAHCCGEIPVVFLWLPHTGLWAVSTDPITGRNVSLSPPPPKSLCWSPNFQYLRIWLQLEIEPLKQELRLSEILWVGTKTIGLASL